MFKKIDHIGIAVANLDSAIQFYTRITGQKESPTEFVKDQNVKTAFFPVGEVRLELLEGTELDSPITKYIAEKGEGIHHICFEVDDLQNAKKTISQQGLKLIEQTSEKGAGGSKIAFIHPKSTGGILMELVEYPKSSDI